mmetsp:Transcript_4924/g.14501  ORF Transcript_4924/g.14501 Transcript_4924/m.14501 type:complete len:335 (+) Transcript_4924:166-1170(+)
MASKLLAASILALAAAQEYHEHTGLKILSKDGARIHQNEPERHALGADGHGVYRPPRPILGRDGHGVATTMPNLTRALLITQTSYCMADADAPLSPAELSATVEVTAVHEHEGARAVIGWDNATKSAWVSFRGTENLENWWDNIQFEKTTPYPAPYDAVAVETGFTKWYGYVLDGVKAALMTTVAEHGGSSVPLKIYGHSAGGACATLMAFDALRGGVFAGVSLTGVYTYGCPRVGDATFVSTFVELADAAGVEHWRVTHHHDIVPHVPQEDLGYLHLPREAWQEDVTDPTLTTCQDSATAEDDACSNSCAPFSCTSTSDHLSYLGLVQGINGC